MAPQSVAMTPPRMILICIWGALGDLIAATVAIRALREQYPESTIVLLSTGMMHDVCPPGTLVDEIILYEPDRKDLFYQLGIVRQLRRRRFDLAVNLRPTSERSAIVCLLSGARMRAGTGPPQWRWTYTHTSPRYKGRRHEFLRHLDIARAAGATSEEARPFLNITGADRAFAEAFFREARLKKPSTLAMHPGASLISKAWLPERFAATAREFVRAGMGDVLLTWGPGEEDLARSVAHVAGDRVHLSPKTTIGRLGALIAASGMCVANYSGAMNVAMAVETPLIALGCTSADDWGPYGPLHRSINTAREDDSYSEEERRRLMAKITVDQVWDLLLVRWKELYGQQEGIGLPT